MTKYYRLFSLLKKAGSKGVSPEVCAKELSFKVGSIAPYMNSLRTKFGAKIEVTKDGRAIKTYHLTNVDETEKRITPNRRNATTTVAKVAAKKPAKKNVVVAKVAKTTKVKTSVKKSESPREDEFDVPTLDADLDITEISDREMADIRDQLGL